MAGVVRQGDVCSGHGKFPPRSATGGSGDVLVNARPTMRVGDGWAVHTDGSTAHAGSQTGGSSSVLVNGRGIARSGDGISCGSTASGGSDNVLAR